MAPSVFFTNPRCGHTSQNQTGLSHLDWKLALRVLLDSKNFLMDIDSLGAFAPKLFHQLMGGGQGNILHETKLFA